MEYPINIDQTTYYCMENEGPITFIENMYYDPTLPSLENEICIDSIHGGDGIPEEFWSYFQNNSEKYISYLKEKDWGANYIAYSLCKELNLKGFYKVNVARAVMDFNRFPGSTSSSNTSYVSRFCIFEPLASELSHLEKRILLEKYYDGISASFDQSIKGKKLKIAVHSYDETNWGVLTKRPKTSLIYMSESYSLNSKIKPGIFDELFIDELLEYTADRRLVSRLGLTLENNGISMAHNYPYSLPEGSVEVRSQVWIFFNFLKDLYEKTYASTKGDPAYEAVWKMLLDTNLRDSDSELLRSYIHMFRRPPQILEGFCEEALAAYMNIHDFIHADKDGITNNFRFNPNRLSSLGLEVRKDIIWDMRSSKPKKENITKVSRVLAEGIWKFFDEDALKKPNMQYVI